MFTMMNNARLNVGLQGVGIAERATQRAVAYALERKQGQRAGLPLKIADHPDVRRMLVRMRALTMGARALAYYAFGQVDRDTLGDREAGLRADVVTPLVKAWCTDIGCEVARSACRSTGAWAMSRRRERRNICAMPALPRSTKGRTASRQPISCPARSIWRRLGLRLPHRGHSCGGTAPQLIALTDAVEILIATAREAEPVDRLAGSYALMTMAAVLTAGWLMETAGRGRSTRARGRKCSAAVWRSNISCR